MKKIPSIFRINKGSILGMTLLSSMVCGSASADEFSERLWWPMDETIIKTTYNMDRNIKYESTSYHKKKKVGKAWESKKDKKKLQYDIDKSITSQRQEFLDFHEEGLQKYGKENWNLLNGIMSNSAKLLEKKYDGYSSVEKGMDFLLKLKNMHTRNKQSGNTGQKGHGEKLSTSLKSLYDETAQALKEFKNSKKSGAIKRVKSKIVQNKESKLFMYDSETQKIIHKFKSDFSFLDDREEIEMSSESESVKRVHFSSNDDEQKYLGRPLYRYMVKALEEPHYSCTVSTKGRMVNAAFIFGLRGGSFQYKCQSYLGNRFEYFLTNEGISGGVGVVVTRYRPVYERMKKSDGVVVYRQVPEFILKHSSGHSLGWYGSFAGALGLGMDAHLSSHSFSPYREDANHPVIRPFLENARGLGFVFSPGFANFFKTRDLKPDFRILMDLLELN